MAHSLKDPLLIKTKDAVETKLPEPLKDPVNRIVVAGMKLLYSPETHTKFVQPIYAKLKEGGFQPPQIATGIANLLGILYKASKGGMKVEAAYPAGVILLTYVLDDLEQTMGLTVNPALLKAVGSAMAQQFVKAFGLKQHGTQPVAPNPVNAQPGGSPAAGPPPTPSVAQGVA